MKKLPYDSFKTQDHGKEMLQALSQVPFERPKVIIESSHGCEHKTEIIR